MKYPSAPIQFAFIGASVILVQPALAAIVGVENFTYANGAVNGRTGGTGWTYERTNEPTAPAQTPSNWNNVGGTSDIVGNALVTSGGGAKREFGGVTEGTGNDSNEREGAFRGTGSMFFRTSYSVDTLFAAGTSQWGGASSFDFGAERLFFGMPGQDTATRFFGIAESGVGSTFSSISIQANTAYTLLGMVDFDSDRVALWVNPDGSDTPASFDVSRPYTGTNWSTAIRLASAGGANVTWDNLVVTDNFAEAVPETSSALLALLGGAAAMGRRRRI